MIAQRKTRNSSKINLTISVIFHSALILAVFFFAAREGMLGKTLKQITVTMAPKEKKPEPPKEKVVAPKIEPAKAADTAKAIVAAPPPRVEAPASGSVDAAPAVAPAAVIVPDMVFDDGAKQVQVADPNGVYKGLIEHALRSRWDRPEDVADEAFVAEVELTVDAGGQMGDYRWVKGSGNARWDDSVKAALAKTKVISRAPPKGFPDKFVVRFDVESARSEEVMQLTSR
jgi:outer membrane biosynthesis protein TonB